MLNHPSDATILIVWPEKRDGSICGDFISPPCGLLHFLQIGFKVIFQQASSWEEMQRETLLYHLTGNTILLRPELQAGSICGDLEPARYLLDSLQMNCNDQFPIFRQAKEKSNLAGNAARNCVCHLTEASYHLPPHRRASA